MPKNYQHLIGTISYSQVVDLIQRHKATKVMSNLIIVPIINIIIFYLNFPIFDHFYF